MLKSSLFPILSALIAHVIAQALKILSHYYRTGQWNWREVFASGGFPSSHSSTVTALSLAIGMQEGFGSALFAVTAVFSFIVMYDACHVRYYSGKNIEVTRQLIDDLRMSGTLKSESPIYNQKLKSILGHKGIEVFGGIVVGAIVPFVIAPLFL